MFRVYDVSSSLAERPETLGSKEKFWLRPKPEVGLPVRPHLFKIGRPNTGENWAEKVCCEILKHLQMPCAEYNFAVCHGRNGVVSEQFYPAGASFVPANMILSQFVSQYDGSLRFRQVQYKLLQSVSILKNLTPVKAPLGFAEIYPGQSAHEFFIGYLLFDALVGNTDRHHENWGVVVVGSTETASFHLAPSFDHASSLGRDQSDERRRERLNTIDMRASVEAYAERAHSAFFGLGSRPKTLTSRDVVANLAENYPEATRFWSANIVALKEAQFKSIFDRVASEMISDEAVRFALRMLAYNQSMIQGVALDL